MVCVRIRGAPCHYVSSTDSAETYSQHAQSLDGTMGGSIPLYRSSEEEKRVTVIKAPHYPGIGPVDESGIPTAIRTVSHDRVCCTCTPQRVDCACCRAFLGSYSMTVVLWAMGAPVNARLCGRGRKLPRDNYAILLSV